MIQKLINRPLHWLLMLHYCMSGFALSRLNFGFCSYFLSGRLESVLQVCTDGKVVVTQDIILCDNKLLF